MPWLHGVCDISAGLFGSTQCCDVEVQLWELQGNDKVVLQKGEAMNQLRDLFPDQKEHMKRLAKPDTTVASVMKQLGYNDSVLLLSAWLCVILTDVNLRKYSPAQIIKRKEELVRVLMEELETSGYALHPEALLAEVFKD